MSDFERVKNKMLRNADKLMQGVTLETHRRIVFRTPVDTGRARGNWMLSEGSPESRTRENLDKNGSVATAEARGFVKDLAFGDVAFIVNNLPYIESLENGHSRQAPAGMVAVTVAEMQVFSDLLVQQLEREG